MPKQGLTRQAYADRRRAMRMKGGSKTSVINALNKGWLVLYEDGSINAEASDRRWADHTRTRADDYSAVEGARAELDALNYQTERARLTKAQADLAELKHRIESGELVEAVGQERALFELSRQVRDNLMAIPARVSAELAATMEPHAVRVALEREIREALRALAGDG